MSVVACSIVACNVFIYWFLNTKKYKILYYILLCYLFTLYDIFILCTR